MTKKSQDVKSLKVRAPRKRSAVRHRKKLPAQLNVGEAKALFSQLVDEAARGGRFIIAKAGTPVARIVPLEAEPQKFVFGTMKGLLSPADEEALLKAIESPLSDEELAAFYGKPLEP
jgi:prevent-host-death family protein